MFSKSIFKFDSQSNSSFFVCLFWNLFWFWFLFQAPRSQHHRRFCTDCLWCIFFLLCRYKVKHFGASLVTITLLKWSTAVSSLFFPLISKKELFSCCVRFSFSVPGHVPHVFIFSCLQIIDSLGNRCMDLVKSF